MDFSKEEIIGVCRKHLIDKQNSYNQELIKIRESATNETKSSMGDKYETSREMMRQEEAKMVSQLQLVNDQISSLERINPRHKSNKAEFGAVVETNVSIFFISISLGKVDILSQQAFVISPSAPLAKGLAGKGIGDEIAFNNLKYEIKAIQ